MKFNLNNLKAAGTDLKTLLPEVFVGAFEMIDAFTKKNKTTPELIKAVQKAFSAKNVKRIANDFTQFANAIPSILDIKVMLLMLVD